MNEGEGRKREEGEGEGNTKERLREKDCHGRMIKIRRRK